VKPNKQRVKQTYARDELNILLLKESFARDLNLFAKIIAQKEGFFEKPMIQPNWTFTVVKDQDGRSELFINTPPSKKS